MPWNDNANPGPWGSPPKSNDDEPQAQPSRRPPPPPPPPPPAGPNFGEVFRRARAEWGRLTRGRHADRLTGRIIGLGATGAAALWVLSGFYVVQPYEKAIVTRFGAYDRTEGPGPRYHLPAPIEVAQVVDVGDEQRLVVGGSSEGPGESLMLTGDGNIIDLTFTVQYRITDPAAWLFQVRDPEQTVRTVAETAMREATGRSNSTSVLSGDHGDLQAQARGLMQQTLSRYHAGVIIDTVQIQNANPPAAAVSAYQDVVRASQDAQSSVSAANAYASKTIADAQSAAAKIAQTASIYQQQVVHEANGEASRFDQIYAQYRRAPAVTRERLYIQTMEDVLARAHVVVIGAKGAQIVLTPPASPAGAADALAPGQAQGAGSPPPSAGNPP